jgi:hypothetical protein
MEAAGNEQEKKKGRRKKKANPSGESPSPFSPLSPKKNGYPFSRFTTLPLGGVN